jgi:hypothetical protein
MFIILSSYCHQEQQPGVRETIIHETHSAAAVKFSMVKRVDLPNIHYSSLFVTEDQIAVCGYSRDDNGQVLDIYDKELNYRLKKSLFHGQGPGDTGGGARFFKFGNRVYAPDNTQQRINLFDQDFKFIRFVKLIEGHYPLTFIMNGDFFLCIQEKEVGFHIKRTYVVSLFSFPNLRKKILHELGPFTWKEPNGKIIMYSMDGVDYFYKQDKIYLLNMNSYQINMFDMFGKILKRIRVDVEKQKVPKEKRKPWLKSIGGFYRRNKHRLKLADYIQPASYMVPLEKGFAVLRRKSYDQKCTGLVEADYFDYGLNQIIGKIQIPCFDRIFRLSIGYSANTYQYRDGYLYLLCTDENESFYLEKWKVEE